MKQNPGAHKTKEALDLLKAVNFRVNRNDIYQQNYRTYLEFQRNIFSYCFGSRGNPSAQFLDTFYQPLGSSIPETPAG